MGWSPYRSRQTQIMNRIAQGEEAIAADELLKAEDYFRRAARMTRDSLEQSDLMDISAACRRRAQQARIRKTPDL